MFNKSKRTMTFNTKNNTAKGNLKLKFFIKFYCNFFLKLKNEVKHRI